MPRRKQSAFEDLIEITSMLPWWVGVVLAIVSYVGLHQVAIMEVAAPTGTKGWGDFVGKQLYKTLAVYLQYILPAAFLIGSAVSAFARSKRNALHAKVGESRAKSALEAMSWREFEQLVGEYFRRQGFSVEETGGGGADGGVDLVLSRGSDRYLVQCKQWKARQVGVATVRELYGVMAAEGAAGGYVVTSGVFTDEAKRFAEGREIELIGGDQLVKMIRGGFPDLGSKSEVTTAGALDPGSKSGMSAPVVAPHQHGGSPCRSVPRLRSRRQESEPSWYREVDRRVMARGEETRIRDAGEQALPKTHTVSPRGPESKAGRRDGRQEGGCARG